MADHGNVFLVMDVMTIIFCSLCVTLIGVLMQAMKLDSFLTNQKLLLQTKELEKILNKSTDGFMVLRPVMLEPKEQADDKKTKSE
jgi:hypothetical protein